MADTSKLGAKIGPRIAGLVQQAYIATLGQSTGHKVATGSLLTDNLLRSMAADLHPFVPPWLKKLAESEDLDPELRAYLAQFLGTPALVTVANALSAVFGVMGLAGAMGANEMAPALQSALRGAPNKVLDPGTVAMLAAHGWATAGEATAEGSLSGYSSVRMGRLINAGYTFPSLAELLELKHRGLIFGPDVGFALQHSGIHPEFAQKLAGLGEVLLPPALLADAVLRGWIEQGEGAAEAAQQGLSAERFQIMVNDTGEPPGLMQLLEAFRRGIIDRNRLHHGIRESRVRNEWTDVVEALRYMPPSGLEAINAEVKGHLTESQVKRFMDEAGLDPKNHDWLFLAAGNPPGAMQMVELWNRGEIDQGRVVQALKQGHLANEYIPDVLKLKRTLIPQGTLLQIQQTGALSRKETIAYLRMHGYSERDAALLAAAGSRAKIAADWQAGKTIVTDQYQLGLIAKPEAISYLETIGYETDEAESIMQVADLSRLLSQQNTAMSRVHTLYVTHIIDAVAARSALSALGVPADQLTPIMQTWTLEREANVRSLSEAQIVSAFGYKILTQDEAQAQLEQLGYPPLEAWTLLSIKAKEPLPGKPLPLSSVSPPQTIG